MDMFGGTRTIGDKIVYTPAKEAAQRTMELKRANVELLPGVTPVILCDDVFGWRLPTINEVVGLVNQRASVATAASWETVQGARFSTTNWTNLRDAANHGTEKDGTVMIGAMVAKLTCHDDVAVGPTAGVDYVVSLAANMLSTRGAGKQDKRAGVDTRVFQYERHCAGPLGKGAGQIHVEQFFYYQLASTAAALLQSQRSAGKRRPADGGHDWEMLPACRGMPKGLEVEVALVIEFPAACAACAATWQQLPKPAAKAAVAGPSRSPAKAAVAGPSRSSAKAAVAEPKGTKEDERPGASGWWGTWSLV